MDEVDVALVTHYAAEDADIAWRLRPLLGRGSARRVWWSCSARSKCR